MEMFSFLTTTEFWLGVVAFTTPFLACVLSPGPDFALVVRNSVMYSRKTGIFTALGTCLGLTIHATYTLIGIALLINQSTWGFIIVKILGAGYLGYLGVSSIFKKSDILEKLSRIEEEPGKNAGHDLTPFQALRMGFLTDILNPFAMVFFISVFALVLDPNTTLPVKFFFGAEIFTVAFIWFATVAWLFSLHKVRMLFARMGAWFGRITGGVLLYYGLKLILAVSP